MVLDCRAQTIINAEKCFEPTDTTFFTLSVDYEGNRGNSMLDELDAASAYGISFKRNVFKLIGGYSTLIEDKSTILNGGYLQLRHNYSLNDALLRSFIFYQIQFNDVLLLSRRELLGLGLRGHILAKGDDFLDIGTGVMYELEQLDDALLEPSEETTSKLARMTNLLSGHLTLSERINITNVIYYQPDIKRFTDFRILNDFAVSFEIAKKLSVEMILVYRYDNEPPSALKQTDLNMGTGLVINL